MNCRHCNTFLENFFVDLGSSPPSNNFLCNQDLDSPEKWYPLRVLICNNCFLLQTEDFAYYKDLFNTNYPYFSSTSSSWIEHASKYVKDIIKKFNINKNSLVLEIAANDGYLLQFFNQAKIPNFGIEPTISTAKVAKSKGLEIIEEFFCSKLAIDILNNKGKIDLIIANNVLAHVPNINDFLNGIKILLKNDGLATFEFPYLLNLIDEIQFDTIYHEHFSYFSMTTIKYIFNKNGLIIFHIEKIPTHGGSIRVFAQNKVGKQKIEMSVINLINEEKKRNILSLKFYNKFQSKVNKVKNNFLSFLIEKKNCGKTIFGYGAAAKGNTLLNYSGIKSDLIQYVIDRNVHKQNMFLPGSRIEIKDEDFLKLYQPDIIIILPWNLSEEISKQLEYSKSWNAEIYTVMPEIKLINNN